MRVAVIIGLVGCLVSPLLWAEGVSDLLKSPASGQFLLLGALFVLFYLFLIRPQSKRAKEHQQLLAGLQKGDEIVTAGGIVGTVTKVLDTPNFLLVKISEGVEIVIQRPAVATLLPKGTFKSLT